MDWDDFTVVPDGEGQWLYKITDPTGEEHVLSDEGAGSLIDQVNGHLPPTDISLRFKK